MMGKNTRQYMIIVILILTDSKYCIKTVIQLGKRLNYDFWWALVF